MQCETCFSELTTVSHSCPVCKKRTGYNLVLDREIKHDLLAKATALMDSQFTSNPMHSWPSPPVFISRGWSVSAAEGILVWSDIDRIINVCSQLNIQKLAGVLLESIFNVDEDGTRQIIPSVSLINTKQYSLRNYILDFPLSLLLFPINGEFLIFQYANEMLLFAGESKIVEQLVGSSISESLLLFEKEMHITEATFLYNKVLKTMVTPVNEQTAL